MKARIGGREVELNLEGKVRGSERKLAMPSTDQPRVIASALSPLILLLGQCLSGKNGIKMNRKGHHYATARFKAWREDAMTQLRALGCIPRTPIDYPVHFKAWYWAGDRITRDATGMQDALFHLLEHSKILKNDGLIKDVTWRYQGLNRKNPKVEFTLSPME